MATSVINSIELPIQISKQIAIVHIRPCACQSTFMNSLFFECYKSTLTKSRSENLHNEHLYKDFRPLSIAQCSSTPRYAHRYAAWPHNKRDKATLYMRNQ